MVAVAAPDEHCVAASDVHSATAADATGQAEVGAAATDGRSAVVANETGQEQRTLATATDEHAEAAATLMQCLVGVAARDVDLQQVRALSPSCRVLCS